MTRALAILLTSCQFALADESTDLLRLSDGELEGRFGGITERGTLSWLRDDGIVPLEFKTSKVRQIILRGGSPPDQTADTAHIELINGDRIPARIIALEGDHLVVETATTNRLSIPRNMVVTASPNPFGGRLVYAGPFSDRGWNLHRPSDNLPPLEEAEEEQVDEEPESEPSWQHRGSKWYYTGGSQSLRSEIGMPDQAILRFSLDWRSRPPIAIAFHADFAEPEFEEPEEELDEKQKKELQQQRENRRRNSQHVADHFGNAYVLTLRSNYVQLQRTGFRKNGEPFSRQIRSSSTNLRFDDSGTAQFEIRCDRTKGRVVLFVDGEFAIQWNVLPQLDGDAPEDEEENPYGTSGDGIGFFMMGNNTPIRVSDIVVAEWNGMPDSARSLESDEFDVVLLTNGTDRFSGKLETIKDGAIVLQGRYAPLEIPLEDIAEIRFAGKDLEESEEESRDRQTRVHFQPVGRLSGVMESCTRDIMKLRSPLLGELDIKLEAAVMLEFQAGSAFLNYWDEDL